MSPTKIMQRAARRSGGVPSEADVYASPNVKRLQRVFPESTFNALFPRANQGLGPLPGNGPYMYYNFLKAAAMWPAFCNESNGAADLDTVCKRELASMFAHFSQEVGEHNSASMYPQWQQGLYYYTEIGCFDDSPPTHCVYSACDPTTWQGQVWPCPPDVKYFGRGAHQLSYNYNYGPFSYAIFGDVNVLLKNPSLVVASDSVNGWLAFGSAFWFYMTPQSPKPSMHDVVAGFWTPSAGDLAGHRTSGFGVLTMIINGAVECGRSVETQQALDRAQFYVGFLNAFGLPAESPASMTCANMLQFDTSGSASTPSYWDQGWTTQSCGVSCQLVSYQTGFSVFDDPLNPDIPYNKCLQFYFGTVPTPSPGASTITSAPIATTVSTPFTGNPCASCATCVAVPNNYQAATDAHCSACGSGTLQSWWPCDLAGLCQCATSGSTTKPVTTTTTTTTPSKTIASTTPAVVATTSSTTATTTTTAKPTTFTTTSVTTTTTSTTSRVTSTTTTKAATTTTTTKAATTTTTTKVATTAITKPGTVNACTQCATCVAVPGNFQSATDSKCSACGSGTLQAWWPCDVAGLCQCDTSRTSSPTTTTSHPSTTSSINPCASCAVCEAIPNNRADAVDSDCTRCGSGTLYPWWPCNLSTICRCKV